jgi:hypothetical protein
MGDFKQLLGIIMNKRGILLLLMIFSVQTLFAQMGKKLPCTDKTEYASTSSNYVYKKFGWVDMMYCRGIPQKYALKGFIKGKYPKNWTFPSCPDTYYSYHSSSTKKSRFSISILDQDIFKNNKMADIWYFKHELQNCLDTKKKHPYEVRESYKGGHVCQRVNLGEEAFIQEESYNYSSDKKVDTRRKYFVIKTGRVITSIRVNGDSDTGMKAVRKIHKGEEYVANS